jgi:hypothetical protein
VFDTWQGPCSADVEFNAGSSSAVVSPDGRYEVDVTPVSTENGEQRDLPDESNCLKAVREALGW